MRQPRAILARDHASAKSKKGASIEAHHSGHEGDPRLCDYGGRNFQCSGICYGLSDPHRRIALEVEAAVPQSPAFGWAATDLGNSQNEKAAPNAAFVVFAKCPSCVMDKIKPKRTGDRAARRTNTR
jgi:hypothetical protein